MKTKKKIWGAVAALLIAIIAAASSTYAWFTMNSKVTIKDFTVGVTSGTGNLLVAVTKVGGSVTSSDYKMTVSEDSIKKAIIESAGKIYGTTTGQISDINGAVTLNAITTSTTTISFQAEDKSAISGTDQYISFDVYFQSSQAMNIYLQDKQESAGSSVTSNDSSKDEVTSWGTIAAGTYAQSVTGIRTTSVANKTIEKSYSENDKFVINPANAIRVGFVGGTTNVWNPNFEQGYNKVNATESDTYKGYNLADAWKLSKGGAVATKITDYSEDAKIGLYPATLSSDNITVNKIKDVVDSETGNVTTNNNGYTSDSTSLLTLAQDSSKTSYTGKLTVYVWLEGNDGDCFNSIFASQITTSLSFLGA